MTTIFTRLDPMPITAAAHADPSGVAVESGDRALTFGEVDVWAGRVANALAALGAHAGTHVVMVVPPSIESFVSVWAVAKTGASLASVDSIDAAATSLRDPRITHGITTRNRRRELGDGIVWLELETVFDGTTEVAA